MFKILINECFNPVFNLSAELLQNYFDPFREVLWQIDALQNLVQAFFDVHDFIEFVVLGHRNTLFHDLLDNLLQQILSFLSLIFECQNQIINQFVAMKVFLELTLNLFQTLNAQLKVEEIDWLRAVINAYHSSLDEIHLIL